MSIIQKKNCGLCRVELTPDDFYTFVSIPLYGQIHDVHIKCIDEFPAAKDQMQIFDQETFKQLEKEKNIWQMKAEGLQNGLQQAINNNVETLQKNREIQETLNNFRIFNQFIVDHYKIIGVIKNPQKQQGTACFSINGEYVHGEKHQLIIGQDEYAWNTSYLIHNIKVKGNSDNMLEDYPLSFNFGFLHLESKQIRYILTYSESNKEIKPTNNFPNYQSIRFGPQGFSWFNSKKYYPAIQILDLNFYEYYKIEIEYEEFLDLSAFRSENPDLFKPSKSRFSSLKQIFRLKRETLKK